MAHQIQTKLEPGQAGMVSQGDVENIKTKLLLELVYFSTGFVEVLSTLVTLFSLSKNWMPYKG